ncbi:class I SAM-dependent methyltransferase [Ramlibacter sp. WS9]|uniref:class I SAM-dependent methyltransferase n=1 Tax=Ramlibacter sp. WS9 TaxID=1882741 RepID=UPI0018EEC44F|nr:class I SAM-dependent methyltransferase [Ramlibacter sp. WS9]
MNPIRPRSLAALALAFAALLGACASAPSGISPSQAAALVNAPDRSPGDRVNDERRKPVEMLAFIGVRPGMTALDVSAGRGYTTELIARAVGPTGKVYGQRPPPRENAAAPAQPEGQAAPAPAQASAVPVMPTLAERVRTITNITAVQRPFEDPVPPEVAAGALDLVTLMFNYHDFGHMGVDRTRTNAALFKALKRGGIYVIADHSGRPGTGISESGTLHRIEEAFVKQEVEAAGFRLVEVGNFMRNPADPRDRNTPVPAMPKDEFVLKFVKP